MLKDLLEQAKVLIEASTTKETLVCDIPIIYEIYHKLVLYSISNEIIDEDRAVFNLVKNNLIDLLYYAYKEQSYEELTNNFDKLNNGDYFALYYILKNIKQILDLEFYVNYSNKDLKKIYFNLSRQYHPDKLVNYHLISDSVKNTQFNAISTAYKFLISEKSEIVNGAISIIEKLDNADLGVPKTNIFKFTKAKEQAIQREFELYIQDLINIENNRILNSFRLGLDELYKIHIDKYKKDIANLEKNHKKQIDSLYNIELYPL